MPIRSSHRLPVNNADQVPCTSKVRKSISPRLVISPNLAFPHFECLVRAALSHAVVISLRPWFLHGCVPLTEGVPLHSSATRGRSAISAADERTVTDVVNRSQSAVGALQATQATNQLLALQSRQAMQAQQLQIAK
ncbi:conjugal transfer protein TrbJ [Variovorax sp. RA8]|nr:conjugal transfer protein TrbJ [Variovorax sp. RA8]